MSNTQIATKDEEQKITALNQTQSFGTPGLIGFDMSDLPIPYVKIIQKATKDEARIDSEGKEAPVGALYHSLTKKAKSNMELIVISAKKDKQMNTQGEKEYEEDVVKVLAIEKGQGEGSTPFMVYLRKANIGAWNKYMGSLVSQGVQDIFSVYLKISTIKHQNMNNDHEYMIFKLESGEALTAGDKKMQDGIRGKYGMNVFNGSDSEETVSEVKKGEEYVDASDIPF